MCGVSTAKRDEAHPQRFRAMSGWCGCISRKLSSIQSDELHNVQRSKPASRSRESVREPLLGVIRLVTYPCIDPCVCWMYRVTFTLFRSSIDLIEQVAICIDSLCGTWLEVIDVTLPLCVSASFIELVMFASILDQEEKSWATADVVCCILFSFIYPYDSSAMRRLIFCYRRTHIGKCWTWLTFWV